MTPSFTNYFSTLGAGLLRSSNSEMQCLQYAPLRSQASLSHVKCSPKAATIFCNTLQMSTHSYHGFFHWNTNSAKKELLLVPWFLPGVSTAVLDSELCSRTDRPTHITSVSKAFSRAVPMSSPCHNFFSDTINEASLSKEKKNILTLLAWFLSAFLL